MQKKNNYILINKLAKICHTSRSAIIRMEQDGILEPIYIDPQNGYRYYDETSVFRVTQNLSLQELGITHRELRDYYIDNHKYQHLLDNLNQRMTIMEYHIENLKVQLGHYEHLGISEFNFPEMYCYTYTYKNIKDISLVRPKMWEIFITAIQSGFSFNRQMHPFVIIDFNEIKKNNYKNIGYDYKICIPVILDKNISEYKRKLNAEYDIEFFAASKTLSSVLYGGSRDILKAFINLNNELTMSYPTASGYARIVSVVSSYPGEEVPEEYWVTRVCIPIQK